MTAYHLAGSKLMAAIDKWNLYQNKELFLKFSFCRIFQGKVTLVECFSLIKLCRSDLYSVPVFNHFLNIRTECPKGSHSLFIFI